MSKQEREAYVFPMAFAQQRLWFLEQLQPGSTLYHLSSLLEVHGAIAHAALEQAVNGVIARHESLRTTFAMADDQPVQMIIGSGAITIPVHDFSAGAAPDERRRRALAAAMTRCQLPFDLSKGPLLRVELFHLAPAEHLLIVVMHHIVSDGWSLGVFVQEMTRLYQAYRSGQDIVLEPLPVQYADYAGWQREWLTGHVLEEQLGFWCEHLRGAPALLDLPTDRPRPAVQRFRGSTIELLIPHVLAERLRRLCQQTKTTPFMLLLGVFAALLGRYSRQQDLVIGTPIANRNRIELAPLIGFFVNTLALRIRLEDEPSLFVLLDRIRQTSLAAHAHQDIPFEQVVNALNPERNLSHAPLFQAMFAYQNVPGQPIAAAGLQIQSIPFDDGTAKFDLTLFVEERDGELAGRLEYDRDLFDATTIERMSGHFLTLLAQSLDYPTRPLCQHPLLTPDEHRRLLIEWNQTRAPYPHTASLQLLIEEQAGRTPAAEALRWGAEALTYAELDARANQLAHYLRERGVGPDSIVGVCAPRRPETIVGLLGILKAGGAYLPLDPAYPTERLRFMASDVGLRHLLHIEQETLIAGAHEELCTIDLVDGWSEIATRPTTPVDVATDPEQLAYVIFTSGSTGLPKGVRIPHRGVVNYVHWARSTYPVTPAGTVPMASALSFDATVTALWVPLAAGCCVELLPENGEIEALAEALNGQTAYNLLKITPAHLDALGHLATSDNGPARVHAFVIGGEALLAEHLAFWRRNAPEIRVINEYGPTETVVGCAVYTVTGDVPTGRGVPIGRPIANTQLYVLDSGGRPVPVGVPGELYIGGPGVGLGYHRRPELTAERFVTLESLPALREALVECDGVDGAPQRLYRSGDLVRYLPDGNLEYLGRLDQQVKLRGFRIELGEIEATLAQHPRVEAAAVALREEPAGRKLLVGYVVPTAGEAGAAPGYEELAAFLRQRLPEYMVPAAIVSLAVLPLTSNGKVDRRALPAPALQDAAGDAAADSPRDGTEATLAGIWQQALGLPRIGRNGNFFSLGGDSILAMQVVSRARAAGLHLTPRLIFQHQTIATLARAVERAGTRAPAAIDPDALDGKVPLTPIQRWFAELDLAQPDHFNQSVLLRVVPGIDAVALGQALDRLVHVHAALRLHWHHSEGRWEQRYQPAAPVPLEIRDLGVHESWTDVLIRIDAATQAALDLGRAPLLRAVLLRRGDDARLLLVAHHVIVDGVSWRILIEDLAVLLTGGEPQPASTPFSLWAEHLAAKASALAAAGASVHDQLTRWCDIIGRVPALPCDASDNPGANTTASAALVTSRLDRELTRKLLQELPGEARASVEEILLTALALAHRTFTGSSLMVLELESHGRFSDDTIDLSRSVGFFTSLYPARIELPAGDEPGAALKAVKEQLRSVPEGGLSYGVWRYLHPDAQVRQRLVPEARVPILFNYLGQLDSAAAQGPFRGLISDVAGATRAAANQRTHLLEVNAYVTGGELVVDWEYSRHLHQERSMQRLSQAFERSVQRLLGIPAAGENVLSPSDFPAARVQAKDLNNLLARLKKKGS